jgi:hypothetical protein
MPSGGPVVGTAMPVPDRFKLPPVGTGLAPLRSAKAEFTESAGQLKFRKFTAQLAFIIFKNPAPYVTAVLGNCMASIAVIAYRLDKLPVTAVV